MMVEQSLLAEASLLELLWVSYHHQEHSCCQGHTWFRIRPVQQTCL
jgi:hypothetical protein